MSTPVRGTEGEDSYDKFLLYAPRRVREGATQHPRPPAPHPPPLTPWEVGQAPPMAPGIGGPNIAAPLGRAAPPMAPAAGGRNIDPHRMVRGIGRRNIPAPPTAPGELNPDDPVRSRFEGDVAMEALRRRLALDPQPVPEPPIELQRAFRFGWMGRLFAMGVLAALGAVGLTWMTSRPAPDIVGDERQVVEPTRPALTKSARGAPVMPVRLMVESQRGDVNEPLALGVSVDGKVSGGTLLVAGFVEGTRLTAGAPLGRNGWHLSATDLETAMAYAPPDFVGAMDARVDLRADGRVLDSQMVRLEWVPKQPEAQKQPVANTATVPENTPPPADAPPMHSLAADEVASLLKRGEGFMRTGDIASARLLLRRAADAGSADAALAMGATFDDAVLAKLGVLGFARNPDRARFWYRKAAELGSQEAEQRLQMMGSAGK